MMERSIPLGRGGTPEEAAGSVYLLCIPESNYVSGQVLVCGGGTAGVGGGQPVRGVSGGQAGSTSSTR